MISHRAGRHGIWPAGVLIGSLAGGCVSAPPPATRIGDAAGTSYAAALPSLTLVELQGDQAVAYDYALPEYGRRDGLVLPEGGGGPQDDAGRRLEARWESARFDYDRRDLLWWVRRVPIW